VPLGVAHGADVHVVNAKRRQLHGKICIGKVPDEVGGFIVEGGDYSGTSLEGQQWRGGGGGCRTVGAGELGA
jgi:hypothetical protein